MKNSLEEQLSGDENSETPSIHDSDYVPSESSISEDDVSILLNARMFEFSRNI